MQILFIHGMMFQHRTWQRVASRLHEIGINLTFMDQVQASAQFSQTGPLQWDLVLFEAAIGMPGIQTILSKSEGIPHRLGITPEIPNHFNTFPQYIVQELKRYLSVLDQENYLNGICYLVAQTGKDIPWKPPQPVLTTAIYHPHAQQLFFDVAKYTRWQAKRSLPVSLPRIGLLLYYSQYVEGNLAEVDALILALEEHHFLPQCVLCTGGEGHAPTNDKQNPPWTHFFQNTGSIELLVNCMAGRLLKSQDYLWVLEELNVPIVQLLRSHSQTPKQWLEDPQGLPAMSAVYSLAQPETFGTIAPTIAAAVETPWAGEPPRAMRTLVPLQERIEMLCRRIRKWVNLRTLPNANKRVTIILHNNPCKGLESTIGLAAGLDTFQSLGLLLAALQKEGYDIGEAPVDGHAILAAIQERKATSEFRWTTIEDIINSGGDLHRMSQEEYLPWFNELPLKTQAKIIEDWGEFPGQGMIYTENDKDVLVVTGIEYGNIRIMVQPKRGCYGSKCTGEVCRILHDPHLAPPHQWLGTYKYIQDNSDAIIHFGTEGALEYLPGKQLGLSGECFSDISIDALPNLYTYILDATGEGIVAKRRGQAVLVDHLSPVFRPAELDAGFLRLDTLLNEHDRATTSKEMRRLQIIEQEIAFLLVECGLAEEYLEPEELQDCLSTARRQITRMQQTLSPEGRHVLGSAPDITGTAKLLATMLRTPSPGLPDIATLAENSDKKNLPVYERAVQQLETLLTTTQEPEHERGVDELQTFCRDIQQRLQQCDQEIQHLLTGLSGKFIAPGLSGSLARGTIEALPTGRNFFATDTTVLPTRAAWETGKQMADILLKKYFQEEGRFPESIGISLWSSDAFKSDGELFCQILYLMGAKPVWSKQGKVLETEPLPLERLTVTWDDGSTVKRPRVDVTLQTSSIMRDLVPNFCVFLDQTVLMISRLDEPDEDNFIRKHTKEKMRQLADQTDKTLSEKQLHRLATMRVFTSAPGTHGLGVGLALDASAWKSKADLAEIYINWGGHACLSDEAADISISAAHQALAEQLGNIDIAYMKQASAEYDALDCSCYAVSQGSMAAAASAVGGQQAKLYWGDSTLSESPEIETLAETLQRSVRTRLLNTTWIQEMQQHGYQGAQDVASKVNNLYKWSATSEQVSKGLFDDLVRTYILNQDNYAWLREANPYALEEITRRLLEAHARDLWEADEDLLAEVRAAALDVEGDMEEIRENGEGEIQGNQVDIITRQNVEQWKMEWKLS
ncbi:cobaltochelatase subunit CobN [Desulfogranum japonicum]|uniref:cobaltochelatase subunit CobN n=1 Tax=Desulfogranum japonicum TaxID=231447 RepID=UPI0003F6823E|nr:cobaltochelatase subunit CobN [Desulfogranum japonicum]